MRGAGTIRGMRSLLLAAGAVALSAACSAPPDPGYRLVTDVRQTMDWILFPAADVVWDSAGFIVTAEGEVDLSPTTDEGWAHVRNSAAAVAETGNLLLMPGRTAGADWDTFARDLTRVGQVVMAAADVQDAEALFDAGGELYEVCRGCHAKYMTPEP